MWAVAGLGSDGMTNDVVTLGQSSLILLRGLGWKLLQSILPLFSVIVL